MSVDALSSGGAFDRELKLSQLLAGAAAERLRDCLTVLLGTEFRLADAYGGIVLEHGALARDAAGVDLVLDIEPVGRLQADAPLPALRAAAGMLELLLRSQWRYQMAARLHEEQVGHDYQRLQQEHAALLKSELRYRTLSEELEERVQQQLATLKTAERQLYQAEKLAAVGRLAAGVAHEINNPIGFIRSNLNSAAAYVRQIVQLGGAVRSGDAQRIAAAWKKADMDFVLEDFAVLLEESIAGADRVTRIVADLKGFSNIDRGEEERVDVNDSIRTVCDVAGNRVRERAELVLELGELPMLRCRGGHLNDVLLALLLNALQAVGEHGVVRIATGLAGKDIRIDVADNGCGIPPENLGRIFDPFFTTRDVGAGTGLGLTVCRDIVAAHGGRIEVESTVGKGTTFSVYLPVK